MKISVCLFFLLCLCFVARPALAQKYRTAAGVRIEKDQLGLSVQQLVLPNTTVELIDMAGKRELSATLLGEQHFKLLGRRLNYYIGGGGHIGTHKESGSFYGFDGIIGVEYKVNGLPLLLSFDLKPAFHINHEDWVSLPSGVSVRFVFIKEKKPKENFFQRIFKRGEKEEDE